MSEMPTPGVTIRAIANEDWDQVKPLWLALYEHTQARGMLTEIPPDGFELWAHSFAGLLERTAFVFVADADGEVVGFFAGRIRVHPKYFGGRQVGYVSDLYISNSYRRQGIARNLMTAGQSWFRERGIARFEGQVVAADDEARAFHKSRGWTEEFVQIVYESELD
jgi:aminoglycoside 6'-N-acetyltransferase I